jgi:hypothetical protein
MWSARLGRLRARERKDKRCAGDAVSEPARLFEDAVLGERVI